MSEIIQITDQTDPWNPDIDITLEFAQDLITQEFPQLKIDSMVFLARGWDNVAYLINGEIIFRFPSRELAVTTMKTEILLLPKLEDQLPLHIPKIDYLAKPTNNYPWPFTGYTMLPGTTGCSANLTDDERGACAKPLATFLKKLHSNELLNIAQNIGVLGDHFKKTHPPKRVPLTLELIEEVKQRGLIHNTHDIENFLNSCLDLPTDEPKALVHGDLYCRHLLFDTHNLLSGIIDWGDAHIGHPSVDLAIMYSFIPKRYHQDFLDHYGQVSDNTLKLAKLRAIYSSIMILDYGDKINDQHLKHEAMWFLRDINHIII